MNKAIKKIELDLGGKMVTLTPEQAKNLKVALDDLFGERIIREIVREKEYTPYPWQTIPPYYWEWWHQPTYWHDRVTCDSNIIGREDTEEYITYFSGSGTLKLTG